MPEESLKGNLRLRVGAVGLYTLAFTAPVAGAVTFFELSSGYTHSEYPWWVPATAFILLAPAVVASLAYFDLGRRERSRIPYAAGAFVVVAALFFLAYAWGAISQDLFVIISRVPEDYTTPYHPGTGEHFFVVNRFLVNVGTYWVFECVLAVGAALMGAAHYFRAGRRTEETSSKRAGLVLFAAAALLPTFILSFVGFFLFGVGAFLAGRVVAGGSQSNEPVTAPVPEAETG